MPTDAIPAGHPIKRSLFTSAIAVVLQPGPMKEILGFLPVLGTAVVCGWLLFAAAASPRRAASQPDQVAFSFRGPFAQSPASGEVLVITLSEARKAEILQLQAAEAEFRQIIGDVPRSAFVVSVAGAEEAAMITEAVRYDNGLATGRALTVVVVR